MITPGDPLGSIAWHDDLRPGRASPRVAGQAGGAFGGLVLTLILYPAALGIFLGQLGLG